MKLIFLECSERAGRTSVSGREKNGSAQLLSFDFDGHGCDSVSSSVLYSRTGPMNRNIFAWKSRCAIVEYYLFEVVVYIHIFSALRGVSKLLI